jgi:pimeloyl-ACP methyl ester carboxylesterase
MNKKVRRFLLVFNMVMMVSVIFGTQIVTMVGAKSPEVNYNSVLEFTQILGTLAGADYEILVPDNWNGMLVIGCRGYMDEEPDIGDVNSMYGLGVALMEDEAPERFAFAWSTYGAGGWCIDTGMIRTHQLTEYVIENYNVQGKVLLNGVSMGGLIACLLGEKYPNLYDGVFETCGIKDFASLYNHKKAITLCNGPSEIRAYMLGPPTYMPPAFVASRTDSKLLQMQQKQIMTLPKMEMECGGTPDTKPQAFERRSAACHADISIPVMSIIGRLDFGVPLFQFRMYYEAVKEAECLDCYRSYVIANGQHVNEPVRAAAAIKWKVFVDWVVNGVVPAPTPPPPWGAS